MKLFKNNIQSASPEAAANLSTEQVELIRHLPSAILNSTFSILPSQFYLFIRRGGLNSIFLILLFTNVTFSQSTPVSFTQEDRDRMIRTETKLDEKFKQAEDKSNQMQKQIDEVKADIKWYFGILIGAMFMLFGFIVWDRRTFIKPFQTRVDEVEIELKKEKGKTQSLTEALRELAKTDSKLAEILKTHNLL